MKESQLLYLAAGTGNPVIATGLERWRWLSGTCGTLRSRSCALSPRTVLEPFLFGREAVVFIVAHAPQNLVLHAFVVGNSGGIRRVFGGIRRYSENVSIPHVSKHTMFRLISREFGLSSYPYYNINKGRPPSRVDRTVGATLTLQRFSQDHFWKTRTETPPPEVDRF